MKPTPEEILDDKLRAIRTQRESLIATESEVIHEATALGISQKRMAGLSGMSVATIGRIIAGTTRLKKKKAMPAKPGLSLVEFGKQEGVQANTIRARIANNNYASGANSEGWTAVKQRSGEWRMIPG